MRREIETDADIDAIMRDHEPEPQDSQSSEPRIRSIEEIPTLESIDGGNIQWAVEGIVAMSAITMISGDAGCGKSTFVSALAHSVSNGLSFMGHTCSKHPVLILDCENAHPVVPERFGRLGIQTHEDFRYWGQWLAEDPPAAGSGIVMEWVARTEPKPLIVVDSFIGFHPGAENDSTETRKYMTQYRRLASLGCGMILLHHTGKAETSKDYRGSSDIKASLDVAFKLLNLSGGCTLGRLRLQAFKTRFTAQTDIVFEYQDGVFVPSTLTITETVTEQLTRLLIANPGIKKTAFERLAHEKRLGRDRARNFLDGGVDAGTNLHKKGPHNSDLYWWIESDE